MLKDMSSDEIQLCSIKRYETYFLLNLVVTQRGMKRIRSWICSAFTLSMAEEGILPPFNKYFVYETSLRFPCVTMRLPPLALLDISRCFGEVRQLGCGGSRE